MKESPSKLRRFVLWVAAFAMTGQAVANEGVTVSVSKIKDLNLRIYGFVETDYISDTTQGFTEEQDNNPVPTRTGITGTPSAGVNNFAGQHHRAQMSIRNSRLGFDLTLPKTDAGLASEGVLELDMLGNNAPNTSPGATPGAQTENNFSNNPAVRVRHAYLNVTLNDWNAKVGQYWSLLGWQPYYFPAEVVVQPAVGQLYRRFVQARVMNTQSFNNNSWTVETAADAAKPAEMNSGVPEFHGGLRVASSQYKGATNSGAGSSMIGLSGAVSAALIPVRTITGNTNGEAVAFDAFIPIIPSKDGADKSNNLSLTGEMMAGRGDGNLEFSGLALGVKGVSAPGSAAPAVTTGGTALDPGIAGINANGNVELIRYRTFRWSLQYIFPGAKWSTSAGYAQVEGRNLDRFSNALNGNGLGLGFTPKIQFGYVSLFYDPFPWLRVGAELNQTRDTYNDPANRYAVNNRAQLSAFFVF